MIITAIVQKKNDQFYAIIPSSGGCAGKALFKAGNSIFEFSNPKELPIKEGDIIKIESSPSRSILTSFIFFIVPLITIATVYMVSALFTKISWLPLVLSVSSFFPTLLLSKFFSKLTYHRFKPTAFEITQELPAACGSCSGCGMR
jgi:positive regulator of sigma E activity